MSTLRTHFASLRRHKRGLDFDLAASLTMAADLNEIEAACGAAGILDIEPGEPTTGAAIAHEWESEKLSHPTPATPAGEELREAIDWLALEATNLERSGARTYAGGGVDAALANSGARLDRERAARFRVILAALQPQAAPACRCGGRIEGWTCQSCGQRFYEVNGTLQPQAEGGSR